MKKNANTSAPCSHDCRPRWHVAVARTGIAAVLAAGMTLPMAGCASIGMLMGEQKAESSNAIEAPEPNVSAGDSEYGYTEEYYDKGDAAQAEPAPQMNMATEEDSYWPGPGYDYVDPFNTEEYAALEESGFIAVSSQPLSTLSSDVDTASYCNLRRMLNDGYSVEEIPAGAVRIEEMLNYFDYDYAAPEGDDLFGVTVRMGDCPWNPDTKLLVMGFSTADDAEEREAAEEAGRNLVFLIDSSGSMDEPSKMPLLKEAFGELVRGLNENDRISIVTYSGSEEVLCSGVPGNRGRTIMRAIRSIHPDGGTNGEAGLRMAYELAQENYIEGGVNRIVMASDGDLNVGMTSESELHDYVADMRDSGVYLSVLGFGEGNYKDTKMETLADNGNGQYHYIDCEGEAERVLGDKLAANLTPLADDVKIQVEFNPAQVKGYRLIGYENRAMTDAEFQDEKADAGDIGPGHQFTVAYEVVPADSKMEVPGAQLKYGSGDADADGDEGIASEWATCTMRYKPVTGGNAEQQMVISADDLAEDPGADWRFAAAVAEFGMILHDSDYVGSATYDSAIELAEASAADDDLREEFCELVELASENDGYYDDWHDDGYLYE